MRAKIISEYEGSWEVFKKKEYDGPPPIIAEAAYEMNEWAKMRFKEDEELRKGKQPLYHLHKNV